MNITIHYDNGNGESATHTLRHKASDIDEAQNIARRIAIEGFLIADKDIDIYVAPAQVIKVLIKKKLTHIVGGQGLSGR